MKNKSISEFVASSMNDILNSDDHKSLFNKFAQDSHKKVTDEEARKGQYDVVPVGFVSGSKPKKDPYSDIPDIRPEEHMKYQGDHNLAETCSKCEKEECDCHADNDMKSKSANLDIALSNLLTVSAVLDALHMPGKSILTLKLASLVSEAKKKMNSKEKEKLLKRLNKGKKPSSKAPSSKLLTSKDFKEMLKKDDDGKLTSKNFKEHLSSKQK
jgi:hypothetical protein